MDSVERCPNCGFELESHSDLSCSRCGNMIAKSRSFFPLAIALAQVALVVAFMIAVRLPAPMVAFFGFASLLLTMFGLRARKSALTTGRTFPRKSPPQPIGITLLGLAIGVLGLAFFACLLFGFVIFFNAHNAVARVEGQPYHAATFRVNRPYYQKNAGFHGPEISVYASGTVDGNKEWMSLRPYLKRVPTGQGELNSLVPTGTEIPIYLFPNLKGRSRVEVIGALPPGEADRRTETLVLRRVPLALAVLAGLIFLLVRIRRSSEESCTRAMAANA
jgi:hypothetical protein